MRNSVTEQSGWNGSTAVLSARRALNPGQCWGRTTCWLRYIYTHSSSYFQNVWFASPAMSLRRSNPDRVCFWYYNEVNFCCCRSCRVQLPHLNDLCQYHKICYQGQNSQNHDMESAVDQNTKSYQNFSLVCRKITSLIASVPCSDWWFLSYWLCIKQPQNPGRYQQHRVFVYWEQYLYI